MVIWPDLHGCVNPADHDAYIDDLTRQRIANLTARQRLSRWWWINWPAAVTILVLVAAIVAIWRYPA